VGLLEGDEGALRCLSFIAWSIFGFHHGYYELVVCIIVSHFWKNLIAPVFCMKFILNNRYLLVLPD
jgi:hypothetical protein